MEMDKPRPAYAGEGCLVGVLRVPVKVVAVLVVLPVRVVWDLLVAVARLLNRHVLGPAGRGLRRFHEAVARPVLRVLGRVAKTLLMLVFVWPWTGLWRHVLGPAGRGLARLGSALAAYVLRPLGRGLALAGWALFVWPWAALWRHLLAPAGGALLTHLLRPLGDGLRRALRAVDRRLLAPLARGAALVGRVLGTALFVWPWVVLWRYALAPAARGSARLARATGVAAAWLSRALLVWPWARLWRYAVVPVGGAAYRYLLAPAGRGAYAYLLAPLGRLLVAAWHLAGRISRALGRGLVRLWRGCVARPCAWAYRQVATPAGHLVREIWRTARAAVREARAEVRRALFGAPPREPVRSRARTLGSTTAVGSAPAPEISLHERQG
ncbi:hypothetical protein ACFXAO_05170 [Streptomyces lavendulae]|uniref:hypothetical protein n=1 Tax=Streptomyces lavendulae TaxID=1914 RepID=UPI00369126E3